MREYYKNSSSYSDDKKYQVTEAASYWGGSNWHNYANEKGDIATIPELLKRGRMGVSVEVICNKENWETNPQSSSYKIKSMYYWVEPVEE